MRRPFLALRIMFFASAILLAVPAGANEYFVVTDKRETLSVEDVKEIFLGQKLFLKDNSRIHAVLSKLSDGAVDTFLEEVLSMQRDQYAAHWRRKLFAGKGHPPKEFPSDEDALRYMQSNPGCLGVVSRLPRSAEVKKMQIFRADLPKGTLIAVKPSP